MPGYTPPPRPRAKREKPERDLEREVRETIAANQRLRDEEAKREEAAARTGGPRKRPNPLQKTY